MPVKLLLIGNSNDVVQWAGTGESTEDALRRLLSEEFHEPAEVTVKSIWPAATFPATLQKWLDRYQPDVVYLNVVGFWFLYESVPLRLERLGGRFGRKLGEAGLKAAGNPALSHNLPFRLLRNLAQRTIGGDTNFTPQQVVDCVSECVRNVVRREGTLLVVSGPGGRNKHAVTRRRQQRDEKRRLWVDRALQTLCEQLHVQYEREAAPLWQTGEWKDKHIGDGLHFNSEAKFSRAEKISASVREAWLAEQARYSAATR